MDKIEETIAAIADLFELFGERKCTTDYFCKKFIDLYFFENSGHRFFLGKDKQYLDELARVTERFSPFPEDHVKFRNVYTKEEDVHCAFEEAKAQLQYQDADKRQQKGM